jgi:hypothetical protein
MPLRKGIISSLIPKKRWKVSPKNSTIALN